MDPRQSVLLILILCLLLLPAVHLVGLETGRAEAARLAEKAGRNPTGVGPPGVRPARPPWRES